MPVSYTITSRVIAKANSIRFLSWIPIFVLYGVVIAWRLAVPPRFGALTAFCVVFAVFSLQPLLILGKHSQGTNDSKQLKLHPVLFILAALFLGAIYLTCGFTFLIFSFSLVEEAHPVLVTACALGMALSGYLLWLSYRIFYDRGRLDTIRLGDR